jgi:hypothetical protein
VRSMGSFCLAFMAGLVVTVNAFAGAAHPFRLGVLLVVLIMVHALMRGRLWLPREFTMYIAFAGFNALSMLWTSNVTDAIGNLQLTLNFSLILVLFGALVIFHDRRSVLTGILLGFLVGAVIYTRISGFPFAYPDDFSYNTIAGMYLFGLFMTVAYGWYRRSRLPPILLGLVLMLAMVATTSIKTNLGVLLGATAVGLLYFRYSLRAVWRNAIAVALLAGLMAYAVSTNDRLMERFQAGVDRVSIGANVLAARDEARGDAGLSMRENWKNLGIKGWLANPVFGNGVESFRGDFGVTSHSTPVDLLYNTGLIGCVLFYGIFGSIAWRLLEAQDPRARSPRGLALGALTCYAFISLSGTMYYDTFLAASIAISTALLSRPESEGAVAAALAAGVRS